jgi:hypothetical protein
LYSLHGAQNIDTFKLLYRCTLYIYLNEWISFIL